MRGGHQPRPLVPRPNRDASARVRRRQPCSLVRGQLPSVRGAHAQDGRLGLATTSHPLPAAHESVTRSLRIALIAGAAALLALPLFGLFLRMRAGDSRIIEPEPFDYALLVISAVGIVLGTQMVPWRAASYIGLVALCASTFLLFGLLAAFSIGLAFIP